MFRVTVWLHLASSHPPLRFPILFDKRELADKAYEFYCWLVEQGRAARQVELVEVKRDLKNRLVESTIAEYRYGQSVGASIHEQVQASSELSAGASAA